MIAIFRKELTSFFSSAIGLLVIVVFLLAVGSLIWLIPGSYNIFDYGFANLIPFFETLPWIFAFLIPAVGMRSFSEERKQGTLELLLTKPITVRDLVLGKFLGCYALSLIAVLPTFFYLISLKVLAAEGVDYGIIISSYLGTFFLLACFSSIAMFASALTNNQIVAFVLGATLSLMLSFGWEALSEISVGDFQFYSLANLGINFHFKSITRGILDSRDVVYFLSVSAFFLILTGVQLKKLSK